MTELYPYEPPDGIGALITWLSGIGNVSPSIGNITEDNVGPDRIPGGPLPYLMVGRPVVRDDRITQFGVYTVHAFAKGTSPRQALTNAYNLAMLAHRRVQAMGPPFAAQQSITLPGGVVVQCDGVDTKEGPTWVQYSETDKSIQQFVTEYDIPWRYIASPPLT